VRVEQRASARVGFAARQYVPMPFSAFLDRYLAGDELSYLTTEAMHEVGDAESWLVTPGARWVTLRVGW
jgi:hypothetical protein